MCGPTAIIAAGSAPELLTLHAVRLKGMADAAAVAGRFDLDRSLVTELLLDFEACGWVSQVDFAGTGGWTLTAAGFDRNQRQLAAELAASGAADIVRTSYRMFLPLNARLQKASTDWQLRPTASDPLAPNDHFDATWDREVLDTLDVLDAKLADISVALTGALTRFGGYDTRFNDALARAQRGEPKWVTGVKIDSCHTVWMELHEDLLATLGIERGSEPASA